MDRLKELTERRETVKARGQELYRSENRDNDALNAANDELAALNAEIANEEKFRTSFAASTAIQMPVEHNFGGTPKVRSFSDVLALPYDKRGVINQVLADRDMGIKTRALDIAVTGDTEYPEVVVNRLIDLIDSRRPLWANTTNLVVPQQGTTIEMPKVSVRPTTGNQASFSAELSSTAFEFDNVSITKFTEGGAVVVPNQMIDWTTSPNYLDETVRQLALAYGRRMELRLLVAIEAQAETDSAEHEMAATSFVGFWNALVAAVNAAAVATGDMPDLLVLGPTGWAQLANYLDSDNRPIFGAELMRVQNGQLVGTDQSGAAFGLKIVRSAQADSAEAAFIAVVDSKHIYRGENVLGSQSNYNVGTHNTEVNFVGYGGIRAEVGATQKIINEA